MPYRGQTGPTLWSNAMNLGQAFRPCRGSCSLIPGRGCFDDLPGDEIVESPPSLIVEPLFLFIYFYLTYSRWTSSLPSCLWSLRIFPPFPGSRLTIFYRDASSKLLQLVNQWLNFTYSRSHAFRYESHVLPLRKEEHKSYFGKNRTHDFRTGRCAVYPLDHSGDHYHPPKRNVIVKLRAEAYAGAELTAPLAHT